MRKFHKITKQVLVVIGNGVVGCRLCQKLVEHNAGEYLRVVVFGEEPRAAYDRVHLTEMFSGKSIEELTLAPIEWYESNGIELRLNDPIVEIDRDHRVVKSASGAEVRYDQLVFATGSRPFVPPVEGTDLPGVFVYRTDAHVAAIKRYARPGARAAVIGGGLLGLEAAKALLDLGLEVNVVEAASGLMSRQLDAQGAAVLRAKIEELGVKVHTGKQTKRIEAKQCSEHVVRFHDESELAAEIVVVSAGIRPRGELAFAAGIRVAKNGGIIVDDHLVTSDPRVFAIGECATHREITYGLVLPGYKMVDVFVDNLFGGSAIFEGSDQSTKLKLFGVKVSSLGAYECDGAERNAVYTFHRQGVYRKLVMHKDKRRVRGALAVGEWQNHDRLCEAIEQVKPLSFWDIQRFRATGNIWLKAKVAPIAEWAADAVVCNCLRVDRGTLTAALTTGCATVEDLSARTRAGTMCGSCKPLLAELLSAHNDTETLEDQESTPAFPSGPVVPLFPFVAEPHESDALRLTPSRRHQTAAIGSTLKTSVAVSAATTVGAVSTEDISLVNQIPRWAEAANADWLPHQRPVDQPFKKPAHSPPRPGGETGRVAKRPSKPSVGEKGLGALLLASALSLLVAAGLAICGLLSSTVLVRAFPFGIDWSSNFWHQVTGYTVLALALVGLLLSARKRLRWFAIGEMSGFRTLHACLGALSLIVLALHTGLHIGKHLNQALMISFLMLAVLGAGAGVVTSISHRLSPTTARDQRRAWYTVHQLLLWPLPILLLLHILVAYYY